MLVSNGADVSVGNVPRMTFFFHIGISLKLLDFIVVFI